MPKANARMVVVTLWAAAAMTLFPHFLGAQNLKPGLPMTPRQEELMAEASDLSDRRLYDSALGLYNQALALNPDAYEVLYEQALVSRLAGKLDLAIEIALRGASYDSPIWSDFYAMVAEIYGDRKQWRAATTLLEQALSARPDETSLLLHLGKSYLFAGESNEARPVLERVVTVDPKSLMGHVYLGQAYGRRRYLSPMILAFLRGMELDQNSTPTVQGLEIVLGVCGWGVGVNDTTPLQRLFGWRGWGVYIDVSRPISYLERGVDLQYDEGNFTNAGRFVQLSQLRRGADGHINNTEKFIAVMDRFIQLLPDATTGQGFAAQYYAPYLKALRAAGHLPAYCYNILKPVPDAAVLLWTKTNEQKIDAYKRWAMTYRWNAGGGK